VMTLSRQEFKRRGLSPRANHAERRLTAKLVPSVGDAGRNVVGVTDRHYLIRDPMG
jgi:hypothetical protein